MMWDGVEIAFKVGVDYIGVSTIQKLVHLPNCIVCTSLRSICVLFVCQIRFKDRSQYDDRRHLCHPIFDRRDRPFKLHSRPIPLWNGR